MYIPVELKVGNIAFGICPVEKGTQPNHAIQNLIIGEVTKIVDRLGIMGERDITIKADHPVDLEVELPEWRISEFDFGGVPVDNPWFDQLRIALEDQNILQTP